ncbi:hypothetical protein C2S52_019331 [Perilla frutescens var. hirtella]|uniref:Uncharacterized protein n=1 Tax=Perilla frutescens var. hirtella TaxID=608512 RepID=A0AAD4P7D4_PERFH|nr:hypothetical protein C2S52_019331 [Perilla frutescens var. hirtella]KAH6803025.1 hypothetical protein C2S51_034471 [Perilla frutescens var. frutescens]KAH6829628.1 hypothetical protein C2S53_011407 [Perilla frutescens var. hirtella]
MEDSKNLAYPQEQKNPFIIFVTNLLSSIKLPFPPKKNGAKSEPAVADSQAAEPVKVSPPVAVDDDSKPGFVKFPRQNLEPVKLEAEADEAGQTTNPLILWQVYALGGFLVMRWAWMRWNERKGQKKSDGDPSPSHD